MGVCEKTQQREEVKSQGARENQETLEGQVKEGSWIYNCIKKSEILKILHSSGQCSEDNQKKEASLPHALRNANVLLFIKTGIKRN